ncbi:MAG: hypothetical protein KGL37_05755, partial [Acidobacteriota bacterium]|nr:hypothetical protein [Acidobacteriota bacterium]
KSESGQVLVLTALSMMLMLGFVGLAVDVGMLFHARRNMQIAADAAALAGALDYKYYSSKGSAIAAAQEAALANGITDLSDLIVNVPPLNGPNITSPGFIEAIVSTPNPTVFMSLFGFRTVNVGARGVAGNGGASDACLYVLDPTADDAMDVQGSFVINAPGCGIVVNSKSGNALQFTGAAGRLTAAWVSVVGGDGGHSEDSTPAPVTGGAPISDPINLTGPTPTNGGCTGGDGFPGQSGTTDTTTTTLTGDLSASGPGVGKVICYTQAINLNNVTLGPGIYVFQNGVTTNGFVNSAPGGTTLDIYGGALHINTGTVLNLVAPTSGETADIVLMEPANNTSQITIQKGDATGTITGIIYAPKAELFLQDSGGDNKGALTFTADIVVGTFFDKTAVMNLTSYNDANPNSRLKKVTLVE